MSERIDQTTGHVLNHVSDHSLSPPQRLLASQLSSWRLARAIHQFTNAPKGGKWFSRWSINIIPSDMECLTAGEALGIWSKDRAKEYWRHTAITWPWVMTAMALEEEWQRGEEAASLRAKISS